MTTLHEQTTDVSRPALRTEGVSRRFGSMAALSGVDLTIARGEIVCLVGHSGCGKSTLLRVIAGIETPDEGRVFLDGREVSGPSAFVEPEARNVGFVFQDYALFPHLTAEENILFGLKRLPRAEAREKAQAIIARVGIGHLAGRYPHMLSGGEQQRVALARALAPQPGIVLMDEPFSNLDQGLRDRVRNDTLSLLKALGTTVIMVTHDPEEALSAGDRVVLMRAGQIVQSGTGYDLHDRPVSAYAAEFFGASNKVPGVYRNGVVESAIGRFPRKLAVGDGGHVTLFVRPQAVSLSLEHGDLPARVVQRRFHGEIEQLQLRIDDLPAPLEVRTMARLPAGTEAVHISVTADQVLVFPTPNSP